MTSELQELFAEPTLAELPKDTARGERIEVEELSDTVKEILPEDQLIEKKTKKTEFIIWESD
jgi:hypothetical protein